ncbi:MAG: hypothetical protein ACJ711_05700, partial [Ornithinibacter sp.]
MEVRVSADAAVAVLRAVLCPSGVVGSRAEWAGAVGSLQQVIDVAAAVQDAAIVRLAAIEPQYLEDGTVVETHRALGHVALDAPSIVSGVLNTAAVHAERRVEAAVLLAADGPDGPDGGDGADGGVRGDGGGGGSGLGGLHVAMGEGRLDAYRASVVAEELEAAPVQVRGAVVTLLEGHFEVEDGAHLRRRCRRALARISPDLLRQRAVRARQQCGLRRWVAEPGVDRWEGTFPSEDAACAWAAIDALASRYVKDGVCGHVEAARAKALTDLVAGQASIETVLTVTVPATGLLGPTHQAGPANEPGEAGRAAVEPTGPAGPQGGPAAPGAAGVGRPEGTESADGATGGAATAFGATARVGTQTGTSGSGPDDLVEVTGPAGAQPVFVSRAWVSAMATPTRRSPVRSTTRSPSELPCTPEPVSELPSTSEPASTSRLPCTPEPTFKSTSELPSAPELPSTSTSTFPSAPELPCPAEP